MKITLNTKDKKFKIATITLLLLLLAVTFIPDIGKLNISNEEITKYLRLASFLIVLYLISTFIYSVMKKRYPDSKETANVICIAAPLVVFFSAMSAIYDKDLLPLSSAFIAALFVSIGWWLGHATTTKSTKDKNTLDIIINMRSNPIYNNNIIATEKFLPNNFFIKRELCHLFVNQENYLLDSSPRINFLRKEFGNIRACIHVLNHYEFISNTILTKQLNEDLLKECYKTAFIDFEKQTCHLISEIIKKQPTAYEAYLKIIKSWTGFIYSDKCECPPESEKMKSIEVGVPFNIPE